MMIVDLNILIYAVNRDAPDHHAARRFWEECLSSDRPIGLAWTVILGFLRVTTHPRVMPKPISAFAAMKIVDGWMKQPQVRLLEPTERHWAILRELLAPFGMAGNVTSDAHLAALAIEHGAELVSADHDFARFPRLRFTHPFNR